MFEDDGLEFVDGEEERKFLYRNLSREDLINRLAESEHHVDAIVSAIRETIAIPRTDERSVDRIMALWLQTLIPESKYREI